MIYAFQLDNNNFAPTPEQLDSGYNPALGYADGAFRIVREVFEVAKEVLKL